jgi:hypothetical protein
LAARNGRQIYWHGEGKDKAESRKQKVEIGGTNGFGGLFFWMPPQPEAWQQLAGG